MTALLENVDGATVLSDLFVASFGKDAAVGCFTAAGPMTLRLIPGVTLVVFGTNVPGASKTIQPRYPDTRDGA